MAGSLRVDLRGPLVLSVLAALSVLCIVGVAVLVLRLQCLGGACFATDPVVTSSIAADPTAAVAAPASPTPAATETPPPRMTPALAAEALIAGTFELLRTAPQVSMAPRKAEPRAGASGGAATERVAYVAMARAGMPAPAAADDAVVRWWWPGTGTPVFPAPPPAPEAAPHTAPMADNAVAAVGSAVADAPPPTSPDTAADGATRIVAGAGVNVRSSASKSGGKLFALAGGAEVALTGASKRGWLEIRDASGRTGWVYSDFLERP